MSISIPTAAFVTARARIHMFEFKNLDGNKCYYTDTDSVILDNELDSNLVGPELGQMKLEYRISKGLFLAPKVYSLVINEGEVTKLKGFTLSKDKNNLINFESLNILRNKNESIILEQEKWYRSLEEGTIFIKKEDYTLSITSGKRELCYDSKNKFISTKPLTILNNEVVEIE